MINLATAAQMKEMDRVAIEERGIPSTILMERAAQGILKAIEGLEVKEKTAAIFSGPGNNGGDGVAAAGLLMQAGWTVRAFLVGRREKMTEDCREMERRLEKQGGSLEPFDPEESGQAAFARSAGVIVDALFGVGLNSELRQPGLAAVEWINASPARVVSADIPSGVEADTGRVLGAAVQADVTVTFSMAKPGLYTGKGALCAGKVMIHDIGIPDDIIQGETFVTHAVDRALTKSWIPSRPADGYKGDFGKLLIVGGEVGYTGAPVLAARGALRSGAGLVTAAVPESVYPIVACKCEEIMARPIGAPRELLRFARGCDGVLAGPGMGRTGQAESITLALMDALDCPMVVDADGINALSAHMDVLDRRRGRPTILTPHDGEFARLGGDLSDGDRLGAARRFAKQHGCLLVLKGHRTITALPDGECFVNTTGNSGMATGGSGDVLAGMILSLLGQGMRPTRAAVCAVYLHGLAGDMAASDKGEAGMTPTDLIEQIPYAFKELSGQ